MPKHLSEAEAANLAAVADRDPSNSERFKTEVKERFGVVPNFFCTASAAPGLIERMWGFAKAGYLDNPLPPVFKERLFVHLSRFCDSRYCIVRHVGFLIGEGRPSGDKSALPNTIDQVVALLKQPVPNAERLENALARLESAQGPLPIPLAEALVERDLFDALTILFVAPRRAERARHAIAASVGEMTLELLTAFVAFVRTAHYWTETHPTVQYEADMVAVMRWHPELARLMLDTTDAEWAQSSDALQRALAELLTTTGPLRASEERFRALVTATSDVIYRMSPDWSEMWQLQGQGFVTDTSSPTGNWLNDYICADDQAVVSAAIEKAVRAKSVFELEHRVKRRDGTIGWTLSRAVPLLDTNGNITEWFGAAHDVTVRREIEESLRDGDRRKNEFLATLAHELRNPLAPLRNGLMIAKRESKPGSSFQYTLDMMDRQVSHLVHLVDDLLDVGRISTGKIELRQAHISMQDVIAASLESCRSAIEKHDHTVELKIDADQLLVQGDFERLTQVFSNLLTNAVKYSERGGRIEVFMTRDGMDAVTSVSDTGIGIPGAELPRIFELFSQVREHRGRAEGGLGIGLSLVRRLVEMHRGSVSAASEGAEMGSTFTVRLPLTNLSG